MLTLLDYPWPPLIGVDRPLTTIDQLLSIVDGHSPPWPLLTYWLLIFYVLVRITTF